MNKVVINPAIVCSIFYRKSLAFEVTAKECFSNLCFIQIIVNNFYFTEKGHSFDFYYNEYCMIIPTYLSLVYGWLFGQVPTKFKICSELMPLQF